MRNLIRVATEYGIVILVFALAVFFAVSQGGKYAIHNAIRDLPSQRLNTGSLPTPNCTWTLRELENEPYLATVPCYKER